MLTGKQDGIALLIYMLYDAFIVSTFQARRTG